MFDPPDMVAYAQIPFSENDSRRAPTALAPTRRASRSCCSRTTASCRFGRTSARSRSSDPTPTSTGVLLGNYNGTPSRRRDAARGHPPRALGEDEGPLRPGRRSLDVRERRAAFRVGAQAGGRRGRRTRPARRVLREQDLSGEPALTRVDPEVNFDWGDRRSPRRRRSARDDFSARWTGQLVAPGLGHATSSAAIGDDGVRVYLDGKLVAEDWTDHAPTDSPGTVDLEAGKRVRREGRSTSRAIGAVARIVWQPPRRAASDAVRGGARRREEGRHGRRGSRDLAERSKARR